VMKSLGVGLKVAVGVLVELLVSVELGEKE
jgi:hypothetical protein